MVLGLVWDVIRWRDRSARCCDRLVPCVSGRLLALRRVLLPGGGPLQQHPDVREHQLGFPFRSAPSSTRLPEGSGADPAAILSPAAVLPGQRHEQKPPGASRLAEPAENSGRPFFRGGSVTASQRLVSAGARATRLCNLQQHRRMPRGNP